MHDQSLKKFSLKLYLAMTSPAIKNLSLVIVVIWGGVGGID